MAKEKKVESKDELILKLQKQVQSHKEKLLQFNKPSWLTNQKLNISDTKYIIINTAKKDDLILLENPEIHLHPKAQAQLGVFLAFVANQGIQLIVETHCEHLINKVRYQVYQDSIGADDVTIHYKGGLREPFEQLRLSNNGQYISQAGQRTAFPSGFFDGTLTELMTMGG